MDLLVLAGFCILFLAVGLILLIKNNRLIKNSIKTTGEIVEVSDYRSMNNTKMYSSKIEFKTIKNETLIIANPSSSSIRPKIGARVSIYYNELEPDKAKTGGLFTLFVVPSILIAVGVLALLVLLFVLGGQ